MPKFKPGQSGNPKGRPKGSRNKLSERFILDLQTLWQEQGMDILRRVAEDKPDKLLHAMLQVLPRDFQLTVDNQEANYKISAQPAMTTDEWLAKYVSKTDGELVPAETEE